MILKSCCWSQNRIHAWFCEESTTLPVSNKLTNPIFVSQDDWLRLKVNLSQWGTGGLTIHEVQDEAELVGGVEGVCHTHDEGAVLQRGRHRVRAERLLWSAQRTIIVLDPAIRRTHKYYSNYVNYFWGFHVNFTFPDNFCIDGHYWLGF